MVSFFQQIRCFFLNDRAFYNTFMLSGETPSEDIIRSVKKGLYAVSFGGGQVDITNGKFVFSASEAYLIEEPMAAAIGAGLPVGERRGSMILDIGGGTTEVAILSMGGVVVSRSLRVAGDEMDEDIVDYARNKYNLLIGERMAERVKITAGSAYPLDKEKRAEIRGRNLVSGLPESLELSSIELRDALSETVAALVSVVKEAIDETPPEVIADLMETGICLVGGGALLANLAARMQDENKLRCWLAEDPMTCVARGAGLVLEDLDALRTLLVGLERGSTRDS